jgi:hypothetical protein
MALLYKNVVTTSTAIDERTKPAFLHWKDSERLFAKAALGQRVHGSPGPFSKLPPTGWLNATPRWFTGMSQW